MTTLKLRFPVSQLLSLVAKNTDTGHLRLQNQIGPASCKRGHLTRDEFLELCAWKSRRTRPLCESNTASFVEEVTAIALAAKNEQVRIQVPMLLRGVNWPTSSVILHFCSKDPYPILDFRALWSLSIDQPPPYTFGFWWEYTEFCRALAATHSLTMRELDMALWQYSKENQNA